MPTGTGQPTEPPEPVCPAGTISEELDLSPAAFVCVSVLPATEQNGNATCPAGALGPVAVPAEPVLYVCVTVGPAAA